MAEQKGSLPAAPIGSGTIGLVAFPAGWPWIVET
jgi:hypothetical protein